MKIKNKTKELGVLSFIFSLIGVCFFPICFIFNIQFHMVYVHIMILGFAILSIGLGSISYRREKMKSFGYYGFIIGIVALSIIVIIFLISLIGKLTL